MTKTLTNSALVEAYQLLKDIQNAAGNDQPYSQRELVQISNPVMQMITDVLGYVPE